jgi:hypothetical protein
MKYGFEDEDDLDFYIQTFLGYTLPKHSFCAGHTSIFSFITDVFFERTMFALAFGSRGSGKTLGFALLNHLKALFRCAPVELVVASSQIHQTNIGYSYFKGFLESDPILWELLDGDPIQSYTKFKNGSLLKIASGTMHGLNGPHPNMTTIDEVELMDMPILEQGLSMSMSKNGVPAQDILGSTRKKSGGTMTTLLNDQVKRNMSVSQFCIWETLEQCTRECKNDPEWGDCIAWEKCKGKAHDCKGWYPIPTFIQKTANLSAAMFATEWENKSPSGGAKVYGEHYDEDIHVISMLGGGKFKSFQSIFQEKEIPKNWRRIGGMDFGAHFAYAQIVIEPRYDIWIVMFEYYFHGDRLLGTHANYIKKNLYWRPRLPIYSDPSGKQSILEMRGYGLNCLQAMNDLAEGVDEVKKRLEINPANGLPKLFIMDTCIELRREMLAWEHGILPDGKPDLDTYEDGNDHMADATRYPCFTYPRMPKSHVKAVTIPGL